MATPIDVVVFKCREIFPTRNRWNRALFTEQKINLGSLSNCWYCADRAQNLPGSAPNIWITVFQISSKSVHFRWSYGRTRDGRSFGPIYYFQYSAERLRANNNKQQSYNYASSYRMFFSYRPYVCYSMSIFVLYLETSWWLTLYMEVITFQFLYLQTIPFQMKNFHTQCSNLLIEITSLGNCVLH